MLTEYIQAAMKHAAYEILEDESFYGEIPSLQGVYANEKTLEACRTELKSVLEGWLIVKLRFGDLIPVIDGIDLNAREMAM